MGLKGILSISGKPGLYKLVGQTKNGIIVESLEDEKRFPAHSSSKISALEDISIYGTNGEKPLIEIYQELFALENGGKSLDAKATNDELRNKALAVFPELDTDRVYVSDLKKLFKWYNILVEAKLIEAEKEEAEEALETSSEEKVAEKKSAKPKAKKTPKAKKEE